MTRMARLYAATGDAVARLDESGDGSWSVELSLEGDGAQCLAVDPHDPDTLYAGLRGGGVRRSSDGGRTWVDCELPASDVFSLAVSPVDGAVYAGTEPSALYRSDDRGESWRELTTLLDLPSQPTWSFPPRPWTSHVRWIAPSPHDADLLLVGIELGGLMRSTDGGETWHDHRPGAHRDVHSLAWHPHGTRPGVRGRGRGSRLECRRRRHVDTGGRRSRPQLHVVRRRRSRRARSLVRVGEHRAVRGAQTWRPAGAHLPRENGTWTALAGGLPDPLPAMPYALVATGTGSSPPRERRAVGERRPR